MTRIAATVGSVLLAAALFAGAPAAYAIDDPVIDAAITAGQVGETAEGFLRVVDGQSVTPAVRDRLNQNEAGRRSVYLETARSLSLTLEVVAGRAACQLIPKNTPQGAMYRNEAGAWTRNTGALQLPARCTQKPS